MRKLGLALVAVGLSTLGAVAAEPSCEREMVACMETNAASVNPYLLLNIGQEELADRFPAMEQRELDLLWFKISDIRSQR
jgi:hypothetical protein